MSEPPRPCCWYTGGALGPPPRRLEARRGGTTKTTVTPSATQPLHVSPKSLHALTDCCARSLLRRLGRVPTSSVEVGRALRGVPDQPKRVGNSGFLHQHVAVTGRKRPRPSDFQTDDPCGECRRCGGRIQVSPCAGSQRFRVGPVLESLLGQALAQSSAVNTGTRRQPHRDRPVLWLPPDPCDGARITVTTGAIGYGLRRQRRRHNRRERPHLDSHRVYPLANGHQKLSD